MLFFVWVSRDASMAARPQGTCDPLQRLRPTLRPTQIEEARFKRDCFCHQQLICFFSFGCKNSMATS